MSVKDTDEIRVVLTRDELEELWFALGIAQHEGRENPELYEELDRKLDKLLSIKNESDASVFYLVCGVSLTKDECKDIAKKMELKLEDKK